MSTRQASLLSGSGLETTAEKITAAMDKAVSSASRLIASFTEQPQPLKQAAAAAAVICCVYIIPAVVRKNRIRDNRCEKVLTNKKTSRGSNEVDDLPLNRVVQRVSNSAMPSLTPISSPPRVDAYPRSRSPDKRTQQVQHHQHEKKHRKRCKRTSKRSQRQVEEVYITGAGSADVNGVYKIAGFEDGVPYYKKTSSSTSKNQLSYHLFRCANLPDADGTPTTSWLLGTTDKANRPRICYAIQTMSNTPPTHGWYIQEHGVTPAPRIYVAAGEQS